MRSGDRVIVQMYLEDGELHDFPGTAREKEFNGRGPRRRVALDDPSRLSIDLQEAHKTHDGLFYCDREMRMEDGK